MQDFGLISFSVQDGFLDFMVYFTASAYQQVVHLLPAWNLEVDLGIVLQTGTPVQNDLNEFYAMVDFANPGLLGPLSAFKRNFAEPIGFSQDRTARYA
jgi:SNF2 family DNA or RNA helicase